MKQLVKVPTVGAQGREYDTYTEIPTKAQMDREVQRIIDRLSRQREQIRFEEEN